MALRWTTAATSWSVTPASGPIWRLSPVAEPLDRIVSCAGVGTTNLAFGGPERKSLFITESRTGTLLRAELETPGLPMFSHAG